MVGLIPRESIVIVASDKTTVQKSFSAVSIDKFHHNLYMTHHIVVSYPEGNFGRNQLLGDSMSLSPLYSLLASDLHVNSAPILR